MDWDPFKALPFQRVRGPSLHVNIYLKIFLGMQTLKSIFSMSSKNDVFLQVLVRFSIRSGVHLVWDSCIWRELFSYFGQKFSFGAKVPARIYMGNNYFLNNYSLVASDLGSAKR